MRMTSNGFSSRNNLLLPVSLVLMVVALYGQFLWNPLVFDDIPFFMTNDSGEQKISLYQFKWLELRSLPFATFAWTHAFFGLDLSSFRLGNLLLHAGTVLALYYFLAAVFQFTADAADSSWGESALPPTRLAFFCALIFAVHPVGTYAVGYLIQRTTGMATLFGLLAMLAYVEGSLRQKPALLWASVPLYYLAAYAKEHAVMLPFALAALTICLHADWRTQLKACWAIFAALLAVFLLVVLTKRGVIGSVYEFAAPDLLPNLDPKLLYPLSVMTQTALFFKYLFLWLFPNPAWMSIDMREPFAMSLWSPYLLSMAGFLAWGAGGCWLLFRRGALGLAGFAMLFPLLMFFTEFSSVRIQESFVLYRSYLWAVGAFCIMPLAFAKLRAKATLFFLCLVSAVIFGLSMERLMVLSQPLFVWDDAEKLIQGHPERPGTYRIYYNRGVERSNLGQLDAALGDFQRAIALNGNFPESYSNLGAIYGRQGDWPAAIMAMEHSITLLKPDSMSYMLATGNLGFAYKNVGKWQSSLAAYNQAITLAVEHQEVNRYQYQFQRAEVYEKLGEPAKAQADYKASCPKIKKACDSLK